MSATLTMHIPTKEKNLPDQLKSIVAGRWARAPVVLRDNTDAVPFIEGLVAAGVPGAQDILEAIRQYGAVELHWRA